MAKARRSRGRRKRGAKKKGSGIGLEASSLIAILTFILIFGVGLFWTQLVPLQKLQHLSDVSAKAQDSEIANRLAIEVAKYTQSVRAVAIDTRTRELLASRDSNALAQRETELRSLFPGVWRVRILPNLVLTPSTNSEPHIGYACIEVMQNAAKSKQAQPAEVHVMGTPQQHIDIQHPVLSLSGENLIGLVQVTLKIDVLQQWLKTAYSGDGYVSLIQKVEGRSALMLAAMGNESAQSTSRAVDVPVPGTSWTLSLWSPEIAETGVFNTNFLITLGVGGLMIFLVIMLLWRSMSRAISTDLDVYTQLVTSELRGEKTHEYHLSMKEFKESARRLEDLKGPAKMVRERDDHKDTMTLADLQIDETIAATPAQSLDNISVEELNDTAAFERVADSSNKPQPAGQPVSVESTTPAAPPELPPAEIFKAYDIRGIVGRTLTAGHMLLIGQALGSEAVSRGIKQIAFARDGRLSGPELGQALVKGLISTGIDVIDVGMVPTPVLYYAAAELTGGSGVMLTGSHNPADYNGVKMVLNGESLSGDAIQTLKQRIDNKDYVQGQGEYKTNPVSSNYIQKITDDVKLQRQLKVVVDSGNGVAGGIAPKLFSALGCEVVELYSDIDGNFPNHHPDPSQPKNLNDLIEMVRASNADVGFAFDGDGDRLGVVSPDGNIIWPDRLMMLFAADVLSRNPGAQIIFDIKCSNNLASTIWEKGGEPVMWKTGHSLIKSKMQQSGALLAGEMSGHIFIKERWYGFDDALYAGARLLEILAADSRSPQEIFASLPDAINTPELRVDMVQDELDSFMEDLLAKAEFPDANIIMIDGVRADFEDGWGLVRASNTTPSLILRFEARDKESLERIQELFRTLMLEINPALSLPF